VTKPRGSPSNGRCCSYPYQRRPRSVSRSPRRAGERRGPVRRGDTAGSQEFLTIEQAAEILHVSRDKVYHRIRTRHLRGIKIRRSRRISRQWVSYATSHCWDQRAEPFWVQQAHLAASLSTSTDEIYMRASASRGPVWSGDDRLLGSLSCSPPLTRGAYYRVSAYDHLVKNHDYDTRVARSISMVVRSLQDHGKALLRRKARYAGANQREKY
jgi:excisionase family DNA binding protein